MDTKLAGKFQDFIAAEIASTKKYLKELEGYQKAGRGGNAPNDAVPNAADMAAAAAPDVNEAEVEAIINYVANTPGATAALIKKQFKMTREQWDVSRATETFKKSVRTEGQKRGTRYYPRDNNE